MEKLRRLFWNDEGQGLVEYAMILGIVAIGVAVALDLLGTTIEGVFNNIRAALVGMPWD